MSDTPDSPLFFTGPIEAAVTTSITQGLPLVCFIAGKHAVTRPPPMCSFRSFIHTDWLAGTDDGAVSSTWQDEYMQDEEVNYPPPLYLPTYLPTYLGKKGA